MIIITMVRIVSWHTLSDDYHDADDYLDHVDHDNDKEGDDLENEEVAKLFINYTLLCIQNNWILSWNYHDDYHGHVDHDNDKGGDDLENEEMQK